ncbi:hypothetical protein BCR35DRAFT_306605 [Leucosporidium creatinivorum]|uniref:Uncharacterized protein n=1 Tax=Leucosporidium creatinivorum TaxID=106004 RepID=A0A1Y2EVC0_9BASI|nr:hypothetical protein BCR35DRAFT_306605 [Leucosporidium creatinivorum]
MAQPDMKSLLATLSTAAAGHDDLQDSVETVVQLVEALTAEVLHHPTLISLSPSLTPSITSLLLALPSSLLPLLGALLSHTLKNRLSWLYSKKEEERARFAKEAERPGLAVEAAVEGVLKGLKGYVDDSDREEKISEENRDLVGEHCFAPLVALLAPSKLKMALKRKVLDIIDYAISHHPSNKTRLVSSTLLGAAGLGRILAESEDYGLTERALELGWRLRDGAKGKEGRSKWDEELWRALGEGEQGEEIRRRWKGLKKATYLEDAADILALLGARDLTRYQNIHALTLTANSHTFVEEPSAPRSASYDQSVSFDRTGFTATTTREMGEDDAVQQVLELELDSVERVLVEQVGDVLAVRIVSFHPPTLDSVPLSLDSKAKDKEHHISFTMRLREGARLAQVLDARELLWESSVDLDALAEQRGSLPTPKKTPAPAPARKKLDTTSDTTSKPPAAATKSKKVAAQPQAAKASTTTTEPPPAEPKKRKPSKANAPIKPLPDLPSSSQHPSKPSKPIGVPLGAAPPAGRPSAPPPGKARFSHVAVPAPKIISASKKRTEEQGVVKGAESTVVVGGEGGRAQKRKAGAEQGGVEGLGKGEGFEVLVEGRKKQRVSADLEGSELGGKKSKSVAFERRSPVRTNLSPVNAARSALSPSHHFGAPSTRRSPAKSSPYRNLFSRADDSGYGQADPEVQLGQEKMDVDHEGAAEFEEEKEEEEEDDELRQMLSQMFEGRPKKEVKKMLEKLKREGGEEDEEMEGSGGEDCPDDGEQPLSAVNSPSRNRNPLHPSPKAVFSSPRAACDNNEQPPPLLSPMSSLRKRIAFGQGSGVPSKAKKSKTGGKEKRSVGGGAKAARRESTRDGRSGEIRRRDEPKRKQGREGSEDLITGAAERDQMARDEIGRTLMALSAIVLDNFQQGRMKANGKFGASKVRLGDKAYKLGMHLHLSTTAVSSATRDEVLKLKGVSGRMQQLAARSRAYSEGLNKEMSA